MVHNIYYQEERNSKNKMFRVSIGIECNHEHLNTISNVIDTVLSQ